MDALPLISLATLTTMKDGSTWNQLQSLEDFKTLDLLLACSDACGFIHNDAGTIQRNINEIGDMTSILISRYGRSFIGNDDEWLKAIRESVINRMYFLTEPDVIRQFASGNQEDTNTPHVLMK